MEQEKLEIYNERYELVMERIRQIGTEHFGVKEFEEYFGEVSDFLLMVVETEEFVRGGGLKKASLDELKRRNY